MKIDPNKSFGTRECPSCATEIPLNTNTCPICHYHFPNPTPVQRDMRFWGAILMLLLFLVLIWGWVR